MEANVKLNLGCGVNLKDEHVNVDKRALPGVDVVHDLDVTPWPWADGSVEAVYSKDCLQYVGDLVAFLNELHRVMAPGAVAEVHVPYYASQRAWADVQNTRKFSEQTFLAASREYRASHMPDDVGLTCHFHPVEYGFAYHPLVEQRSRDWREFAARHYSNVVTEMVIWLTKGE